jgi:hypothetical protein
MAATQCDSAQFVSDLTAPDGAVFAPGATFTKTWRLMNNGTCAWTQAYNLVFAGGDSMGAPLSVKLPAEVPPGQMVDVSVNLTAPIQADTTRAYLRSAMLQVFNSALGIQPATLLGGYQCH